MSALSYLLEVPLSLLLFFAMWVGACFTSFGRVAVFRLPHQMGWREDPEPNLTLCSPPSRCDTCHTKISKWHLLPIFGWFLTKGRCPSCKMLISILHPMFELVGGIGWIAALLYFGFTDEGLAACLLWQSLLFLAEMDWRETWLPAVITFPLFWIGLLFSPFTLSIEERAWGAFIGFFTMWFSMTAVGYLKKMNLFAGGDIALACAAGAWIGIGKMPIFLFSSAIIFILIALPARLRGQMMVPMGPALAIAFLISIALPK